MSKPHYIYKPNPSILRTEAANLIKSISKDDRTSLQWHTKYLPELEKHFGKPPYWFLKEDHPSYTNAILPVEGVSIKGNTILSGILSSPMKQGVIPRFTDVMKMKNGTALWRSNTSKENPGQRYTLVHCTDENLYKTFGKRPDNGIYLTWIYTPTTMERPIGGTILFCTNFGVPLPNNKKHVTITVLDIERELPDSTVGLYATKMTFGHRRYN